MRWHSATGMYSANLLAPLRESSGSSASPKVSQRSQQPIATLASEKLEPQPCLAPGAAFVAERLAEQEKTVAGDFRQGRDHGINDPQSVAVRHRRCGVRHARSFSRCSRTWLLREGDLHIAIR